MSTSTSQIPQQALGSTGQMVSRIGLGCASYWAKPGFSEKQARAVLETALNCGITLFDTGASYSAGHAELRLGRLLRELQAEPDGLLIGTKVGTVSDSRGRLKKDFRPESITRQLEQSLQRLELDRIGLLQLHGPEPSDLSDELLKALEQFKTQGKVELLGINAHQHSIRTCIGREPFDVLMPFISLLELDHDQLAEQAEQTGQGVLAAGPLARMLFAPPLQQWLRQPSGWWYLARALRHPSLIPWQRIRALRSILKHTDWSAAQLALAWVLEQPGVSCAVFGTTRPVHILELAAASQRELPADIRNAVARLIATDRIETS